MNKKEIKKAVNKGMKMAQKKGKEILSSPEAKELEKKAVKEYEKVKKQMEKTAKQAEAYMKKNPGKSALISAGIGAALAGAAALMLSGKNKKTNKKKK